MNRHTTTSQQGITNKGLANVVRDALNSRPDQLNMPLSRAFIKAHGLADPEPFVKGGQVVEPAAQVIEFIGGLEISDEFVTDCLKRLELQVANDQRRKALRYVKGGHVDLDSLELRTIKEDSYPCK